MTMAEMKQFFKQLFCHHKWELRYVKKYGENTKRVAVICKRCGKELELR